MSLLSSQSEKCVRQNENTHFIFNRGFAENRVVFELMWENVVQPDRPQVTVLHNMAHGHSMLDT